MSEPGEQDDLVADDTGSPRRPRVAPFVALAVAVALSGLFVVLARSDTDRARQVQSFLLGRPAPGVVSTTLDDEPFDLSRRKGSWVVLNFFDPTCVPCIEEHPELMVLAEQQSLIADGAELYTIINKIGSDASVRDFFEANGGDWPVIRDPDGGVSVDFGVAQVPETWIIDPTGVVRRRFVGPVTADDVGRELQAMREGLA